MTALNTDGWTLAREEWEESGQQRQACIDYLMDEIEPSDVPLAVSARVIAAAVTKDRGEMTQTALDLLKPEELPSEAVDIFQSVFDGSKADDLAFDNWVHEETTP